MENTLEIQAIVEILKQTTYGNIKNIEEINTGSNHKSKEEIVDYVCRQSRGARRLNSILHSCLDWLLYGKTVSEFYDKMVYEATRKDQCEQDRVEKQEELAMFTEHYLKLQEG